MFVQNQKNALARRGRIGDLSFCGQESNRTTWRLAHMNLAIRGIEENLGEENADGFVRDPPPTSRPTPSSPIRS